jgi:hypothetical protein
MFQKKRRGGGGGEGKPFYEVITKEDGGREDK